MKIYISPSSQTANMYSGMNGVSEAAVCRQIGTQLYDYLKPSFSVVLADAAANVAGRISASNAFGADLHICIHTNAASSDVTGTLVMCDSSRLQDPVVTAVYRNVASMTPSLKDQGIRASTVAEIRSTLAKCVYIEVDYHSNTDMAKWLATHTEYIALAIAAGIQEGTGITIPAVAQAMKGTAEDSTDQGSTDQGMAGPGWADMNSHVVYRAISGSYTTQENAQRQVDFLNSIGVESWVSREEV